MASPDRAAQWWTIADVAAYLNVGEKTVASMSAKRRRAVSGNPFPAPHYVSRTPVWPPAVIVEWHARRPGRGRWAQRDGVAA